ncbi:SDR family oxidoreductase [Sinomicrobium kalidii]|uniref:SDR family NAD(P)-dependent oxidoreductase n=1 Tax=Sinomicrobium kalidii TaxID=2900738 RepID=UPI001E439FC0|nr:SDR family oxidoreductase [Sinomicrobium kalidii]UGU18400.1 SDR family oxidoreductase [Sinomicrobium kalidii]
MERNKIALVTGGSRGLGKDMALRIADKGIDVVLTYHNNQEKAEEVVKEIQSKGQKAIACQLNTAKIDTFDAFIEKVTAHLKEKTGSPNFDFLINNAGIGINKPFLETTEDEFDSLVNIHFKGVFFLTQKALKFLNDGSSIINISSGLARFTAPGYSVYASAKAAIESLTRYQAKELSDRQIRVNTVAPGAVATDFAGGEVRDNEKYNNYVSSATALGRPGVPEDIGGVVAFLCTEDAAWINGQRIEVSGGMNL